MRCRVVRLEFDRALVFAQSAGEIDFAKEELSQVRDVLRLDWGQAGGL